MECMCYLYAVYFSCGGPLRFEHHLKNEALPLRTNSNLFTKLLPAFLSWSWYLMCYKATRKTSTCSNSSRIYCQYAGREKCGMSTWRTNVYIYIYIFSLAYHDTLTSAQLCLKSSPNYWICARVRKLRTISNTETNFTCGPAGKMFF